MVEILSVWPRSICTHSVVELFPLVCAKSDVVFDITPSFRFDAFRVELNSELIEGVPAKAKFVTPKQSQSVYIEVSVQKLLSSQEVPIKASSNCGHWSIASQTPSLSESKTIPFVQLQLES